MTIVTRPKLCPRGKRLSIYVPHRMESPRNPLPRRNAQTLPLDQVRPAGDHGPHPHPHPYPEDLVAAFSLLPLHATTIPLRRLDIRATHVLPHFRGTCRYRSKYMAGRTKRQLIRFRVPWRSAHRLSPHPLAVAKSPVRASCRVAPHAPSG